MAEWREAATGTLGELVAQPDAWARAVPANAQAGVLRVTWPDAVPDWLARWLGDRLGGRTQGNVTDIDLTADLRQTALTSLQAASYDPLLTLAERQQLVAELSVLPVALPTLGIPAAIRAGIAWAAPLLRAVLARFSGWIAAAAGLIVLVPIAGEQVSRGVARTFTGFLDEITTWAKANPEMAAVLGVGALILLRR